MSPQALVLIVDDDPELRKFLAGELAAEGYGVETAGTGQQALTRIREGGLDLVVLMLTARDDVRERVDALDEGADYYLTKPFLIEELLAWVRVYRGLNHLTAKKACSRPELQHCSQDLARFLSSFPRLQELRHQADYDSRHTGALHSLSSRSAHGPWWFCPSAWG